MLAVRRPGPSGDPACRATARPPLVVGLTVRRINGPRLNAAAVLVQDPRRLARRPMRHGRRCRRRACRRRPAAGRLSAWPTAGSRTCCALRARYAASAKPGACAAADSNSSAASSSQTRRKRRQWNGRDATGPLTPRSRLVLSACMRSIRGRSSAPAAGSGAGPWGSGYAPGSRGERRRAAAADPRHASTTARFSISDVTTTPARCATARRSRRSRAP